MTTKKVYYSTYALPAGKREMTDEEFRDYVATELRSGARLNEIPALRPLVDLKENEEIVFL